MKPSTLVELVGFVCLVRMGFLFGPEAGWGTAGGSLLLVGFLLDDQALVGKVVVFVVKHKSNKAARAAKRAAKKG